MRGIFIKYFFWLSLFLGNSSWLYSYACFFLFLFLFLSFFLSLYLGRCRVPNDSIRASLSFHKYPYILSQQLQPISLTSSFDYQCKNNINNNRTINVKNNGNVPDNNSNNITTFRTWTKNQSTLHSSETSSSSMDDIIDISDEQQQQEIEKGEEHEKEEDKTVTLYEVEEDEEILSVDLTNNKSTLHYHPRTSKCPSPLVTITNCHLPIVIGSDDDDHHNDYIDNNDNELLLHNTNNNANDNDHNFYINNSIIVYDNGGINIDDDTNQDEIVRNRIQIALGKSRQIDN